MTNTGFKAQHSLWENQYVAANADIVADHHEYIDVWETLMIKYR